MIGTNRGFHTQCHAINAREIKLFFFLLIVKESRTEKKEGCRSAKEYSENY
jgi:hypothetical protein